MNTSQTVRFLDLSFSSLDKAKNRAQIALVKKICATTLLIGFSLPLIGQTSSVRDVTISSPQTLLFTGNGNVLKNPERGLSLKAGYFDLFVDQYNYDGSILLDLKSSNVTKQVIVANRESFSGIDMDEFGTQFRTKDTTSSVLYRLMENEPIIAPNKTGYSLKFPNKSLVFGVKPYAEVQITNCSFNGNAYPLLKFRFHQEWVNRPGLGWVVDYGVIVYTNDSPAQIITNDNNPVYDEVTELKFTYDGNNLLSFVTNKGNILNIDIDQTSQMNIDVSSHSNLFTFESIGTDGVLRSDLGFNTTDFNSNLDKEWNIDISTNISHDSFFIDLEENPISTSNAFSFDTLTNLLSISDAYFNETIVDQATNKGIELPASYINSNGISLVELEQYIHFSENNIANNHQILDQESINKAKAKFDQLEALGLKSHLILNSDFRMSLENGGTTIAIPEFLEFQYLLNMIDTLNGALYSDDEKLVAFSHLGLMNEHNDFNYYRHSPTWLNHHSKYFGLNGNLSPEGILSENRLNNEGSLRASEQKSAWKYYSASSAKTGYPFSGADNQMQYIREEVIDKVTNVFEDKKVLLEEVIAWNHKMTFPQAFPNDQYDSNGNLGFYDGAFGTTYDHLYTIGDNPQRPPFSHDFTNIDKRDLYVLGKHSDQFWVHGEMPVYMNENQFDSIFSFESNWVNNDQYNVDVFKGMATVSTSEQDALLAAKKLRMFNFSSFDITLNNSENFGKNIYESTNPNNGVGAIDKWRTTNINQTQADNLDLPYSTNYFNQTRTVFDYIRDHLGYRLEMKSLSSVIENDTLKLSAEIQNRGFSAPKNKRDVYFVILDDNGNEIEKIEINSDWRTWRSDSTLDVKKQSLTSTNYSDYSLSNDLLPSSIQFYSHKIEAEINTSLLQENTQYTIALWMPDMDATLQTEAFAVKLANDEIEIGSRGENLLSRFVYKPTFSIDSIGSVCENDLVTLSASQADSYLWSNGETTQSIQFTADVTESYSVIGTMPNGSQLFDTIEVIVNDLPIVNVSGPVSGCEGDLITLTANGADEYLWSNGETSSSVSFVLSSNTTITVTGTTNGCSSNIASTTVNLNTTPIVNISGPVSGCEGDLITLTAIGADSYVWNNGATTSSISFVLNSDSTFSVTGITNGCTSTQTNSTVTLNSIPVVNISGPASGCEGELITLTAAGANSYLWSNGATTPSISFALNSDSVLSVVGTTNGCSSIQANATVNLNSLPNIIVSGPTSGCMGDEITFIATGADSYQWSNGATTPSVSFVLSSDSSLSVTGTTNGCASTPINVSVNLKPAPIVNISGPVSGCDGDLITLTASGADSYLWSNGATSPSVSFVLNSDSTLSVTGTTNGCGSAQANTTVNLNATPVVNISGPVSGCDGELITLTASGADSYVWSNGATSPSVSFVLNSDSTLSVTGTTNGCSSSQETTTVNLNATPVVNISGPVSGCEGDLITLTASGADSYLWSNGATTPSVSFVLNSDSTLSVTGTTNGCGSAQANTTVNLNATPVVNISGPVSGCDGELITLTASGADSYVWSNGATSPSVSFVLNSDSTLSVTGTTNGCGSAQVNTTVNLNATPVVNISGPVSGCEGDLISLTASGADSYVWSNGATTANVSFVLNSDSTLSVTGTTNGCSSSQEIATVNLNATPVVSITGPISGCVGDLITLTATGADSYVWSNGATTASISFELNSDSTLSVTGTTNGCASTPINVSVNLKPAPIVNISGPVSGCEGDLITLTASGADSYVWSNGATTANVSFVLSSDSILSVTGTTNGCGSAQANTTVNLNATPVVNISGPVSGCEGDLITLTASGADSYVWSNGATTANVSFVLNSDSTLSVTGTTNGCSSAQSDATVNLNATPVVSIAGPISGCEGDLITLTASGADSYLWSNGATTASVSFVLSSDSTLSVTGTTNGCSSTQESATVNLNATPIVNISGPVSGCEGDLITLTASGADSYVWSNGATTANVSFALNSDSTLSVIGTTNGCSSAQSDASVTLNATPVVNISGPVSGCDGELITLTATGADSYVWSNGATTASISFELNSDSTISVTGTTNGCSSSQETATVNLNATPVVNISGPVSGCDGDLITLTATGADSYVWSNGATMASISFALNSDSTISVTGTTNGCGSAQANTTVNLNATPVVNISGPVSGCEGDLITLTASGADSYVWSNGATSPSVSFVLNSDSTLSVTGTTNGCSSSQETTTVNLNATPVVNISGPVSGCVGDLITLTATGADSYVWSNGATTASISFELNSDSTLSVTGTTNGCTSTQTNSTVTLNSIPVVNISGPASGCEGELITLTAAGANSYLWSNGATTPSISFALNSDSVLSVVGTTNGCSSIQANATVNLNSLPNIIVSGPTSGCMGDEITFIATGADSYQWSNGATTPSVSFVLSSDSSLSVIGTTNGCESVQADASVTLNATPVVNISGPVSGCDGDLITLTASGADSYVWNNGATTASISFALNSDSTLSVTGTTNGCGSAQANTTVNLNATPVVNIAGPVSGCEGDLITLTASGADSYVWSNGATTENVSFVLNSDSTLSVTGTTNGCGSAQANTTVNLNATPVVNIAGPVSGCEGDLITLTASGADSYVWSNGATTADVSFVLSSDSTLSVTGTTNGCGSAQANSTVNLNATPVVSISGPVSGCDGDVITLTATGADSYVWSNGATTANVSFELNSDSTLSVTGITNGCSSIQANATVNLNSLPNIIVSGPTSGCMGDEITFIATGADSYQWSNGATTPSVSFVLSSDSSLSVIGTTNGCESVQADASVTLNATPVVNISGPVSGCDGDLITLTASGADSYVWSTGETTNAITFTFSDEITISVEGNNSGCGITSLETHVIDESTNCQVNNVDMEITKLDLSLRTVVKGDDFDLNVNLHINGQITDPSTNLIYTLSQDTIASNDDLFLGSEMISGINNLNGQTIEVIKNIQLPQGLLGMWNVLVQLDSDELIEESDEENNLIIQPISIITPEQNFANNSEFHSVSIQASHADDWHEIQMSNTYNNPVIIIGGLTLNSNQSVSGVRIKDVQSNSFKMKIEEWDYLDGSHSFEDVNYMIIEAGEYTMSNGKKIIAEKTTVNSYYNTINISTSQKLLFAQTMSFNSSVPVTTRIKKNWMNFEIKLQREEAKLQNHPNEDVGYVVFDNGIDFVQLGAYQLRTTTTYASHRYRSLYSVYPTEGDILIAGLSTTYDNNTATVRYKKSGNRYRFKVQEERSQDNEMYHFYEQISVLYLKPIMAKVANVSENITQVDVVENNYVEKSFDIFPNPTNQQFTIALEETDEVEYYEMEIYDTMGQLLKRNDKVGHYTSVDVTDLPSGSYIIVLKSDKINMHQTLIITE